MEANLYIDVGLLALALSMYVTKSDKRIILTVLVILFGHVILTMDQDDEELDEELDDESDEPLGEAMEDEEEEKTLTLDDIIETMEKKEEEKIVHATVSSDVFGRQMSTPQNMLTRTIFPTNSKDANGKLADARGSFFNSLVA